MKRELKKKVESPEDFTARNLISSLDKQMAELDKNNDDIESILKLIQSQKLSDSQEKNIMNALNDSFKLSSNMQKSIREDF